jgi:hypothetical protein
MTLFELFQSPAVPLVLIAGVVALNCWMARVVVWCFRDA